MISHANIEYTEITKPLLTASKISLYDASGSVIFLLCKYFFTESIVPLSVKSSEVYK